MNHPKSLITLYQRKHGNISLSLAGKPAGSHGTKYAIDRSSDGESDDDLLTLTQLARRPLGREDSKAESPSLKRKP